MLDAISTGLSGLQSAVKKVDTAATRIANVTTPPAEGQDPVELSEEAVNLIVAELEFKANAATITTASELSEELLDILDD